MKMNCFPSISTLLYSILTPLLYLLSCEKKKQRFINRARFKYLLLVSSERTNRAHYVARYTILLSFISAGGKKRKMDPG